MTEILPSPSALEDLPRVVSAQGYLQVSSSINFTATSMVSARNFATGFWINVIKQLRKHSIDGNLPQREEGASRFHSRLHEGLANDTTPRKVDVVEGVYRDEESRYHEFTTIRKAKMRLNNTNIRQDYNATTDIPSFAYKAVRLIVGKHRKVLSRTENSDHTNSWGYWSKPDWCRLCATEPRLCHQKGAHSMSRTSHMGQLPSTL